MRHAPSSSEYSVCRCRWTNSGMLLPLDRRRRHGLVRHGANLRSAGRVPNPLLTYYTGVIRRAARTSSAAALVCVLGFPPAAPAQDLAFPGGVIWQLRIDPPPAQLPAFDDSQRLPRPARTAACARSITPQGRRGGRRPQPSTVRPASSGRYLAGADGASAWAIDAASGRSALAPRPRAPPRAASPAATTAGAVFLTEAGDLVLLAWADGRDVWRARMPGRVSAPLDAGARPRLCVGLDDGRVLAIRLADGTIAWTSTLGARVLGMTVIGDRLFAGAADNFLYALRHTRRRRRLALAHRRRRRRSRGRRRRGACTSRRSTPCCGPSIAGTATCDGSGPSRRAPSATRCWPAPR